MHFGGQAFTGLAYASPEGPVWPLGLATARSASPMGFQNVCRGESLPIFAILIENGLIAICKQTFLQVLKHRLYLQIWIKQHQILKHH